MQDRLASNAPSLCLEHGLALADLYSRDGLQQLDRRFVDMLRESDPALASRLADARIDPDALGRRAESDLLIALAVHVEDFVASLFGVEAQVNALESQHHALAPLYVVKRQFVQRKAMNAHRPDVATNFDADALRLHVEREIGASIDDAGGELAFARAVLVWQGNPAAHAERLDIAARYAAWASHTQEGRARHRRGVLFRAPRKLDVLHLVPVRNAPRDGVPALALHEGHPLRDREGFALTDAGTDLVGALDEAHYCIWCHEQGKDSCSQGLREKAPADGSIPADPFKRSAFGIPLAGCPLEEKISEFQKLLAEGWPIGALAMICVDNPLAAATGHRICNDCMKSCIYQKQEPVNIPQAETRALRNVLSLPFGFEIYSLLTRWNPLDLRRPFPKAPSGRRVLVVGMGPAGFTLAHHLVNDGHTVVGIDALKIEPLAQGLGGVRADGSRAAFGPVADIDELVEALDDRLMAGFGGVAEYGITVRWDKNFLKIVRLLLERRAQFALYGGVRFGGTLDGDRAFELGFDHIALAAGAGRPTVLELPNGLANGVRTASDFLMALQLTGAAKADSLANMQLRLPVVVIGGGLTAIDTATESLAYYPVQVEKFLSRYEALVAASSESDVRSGWAPDEAAIADEYLEHARAIRVERALARRDARAPDLLALLDRWGGVTIAYRRRLVDSPSYTLNHEEVEKALEEGIRFAQNLTPVAVDVDACGRAEALRMSLEDGEGSVPVRLSARTILIAAGTQPNTILAREHPAGFALDEKYFRLLDEEGRPVAPQRGLAKPLHPAVLTQLRDDGRAISFFGDLHPSWAGNVVKAMASATKGYPIVSRVLARVRSTRAIGDPTFFATLDGELRATVERVVRLTPTIVEVVVRAPAAARAFRPGQFYRLQNYESLAAKSHGATLAMEGLALTGAWVDRDRGLVSTIVLEMGGSSDLCANLRPGEPVVLMGPTGTPTDIPAGETVLLAGGGLGNAVLFSIGEALRNSGSRVLYFAGYKKGIDRYKVDEIEAAADVVVWCCDEPPGFAARRPQDRAYVGNIVAAMRAYAAGELGTATIAMSAVDRLIAIGSDRMMNAVRLARSTVLAPFLKDGHAAIGSINSPMQCMMKEVCGQCLQPHVDPRTGARSYVFSCFNQDQPLDCVDFAALAARLTQNGVQEKLTARFIGLSKERHLRSRNAREW